ncbi:zona pellucida sperm-binding protein 4-like [Clinocottus analis]|uniref:zona pellucida sperm-binding protein 4-like n=1 Tax=Clinocottus analis TaxID=304258 RepID=UPI0035BF094A
MAMKLICGCLLAVVLLGCIADAQYQPPQKPQQPPQKPQQPPQKPQQPPQRPQQPPQRPQQPPQKPQQPAQRPQQPAQRPQQPAQRPQQPAQRPQQTPSQQRPKYPNQQSKYPQEPTESFHTCEVSDRLKIQCGAPAITASDCEAINCCFDGRMCYYGKAVTLQCTKDAQMIVVVARDATLPNIDLESVSFLAEDPTCNPVGVTSAFAIYQFPVTACGTVMTEEPGVIIYENRMSSLFEVALGPYGVITRDSHYELLVQCRYIGTTVLALVVEVGLIPPPPPVAAPGPLRVELRLGNGQCISKGCLEEDVAYNSFYVDSDYPVTKVLRDPVYVEVRMLERTDPNLVLTLGRCWATSNPYPHSLPQWDLLIDGCPYSDDRYRTTCLPVNASPDVLYPSHYRRFVFKMFTFVAVEVPQNPSKIAADHGKGKGGAADPQTMVPLNEKVYIHCDTAVCQPTLGNSCEPRCSRKRRDVAASGQGRSREETTLVSSHELVMTN